LIGTDNIEDLPCVRKCCLDDNNICLGCFRSLDEIVQWHVASNHERIVILQNARQRQEAKLGVSGL